MESSNFFKYFGIFSLLFVFFWIFGKIAAFFLRAVFGLVAFAAMIALAPLGVDVDLLA